MVRMDIPRKITHVFVIAMAMLRSRPSPARPIADPR